MNKVDYDIITYEEAKQFIKYKTTKSLGRKDGMKMVFNYLDGLLKAEDNIRLFSPIQVGLSITDNCNLRCTHCSRINDLSNGKHCNMKEWKKVVDQLCQSNVLQIFITGGEPLTHPHFKDIVEYIKSKNIALSILTNGLLLDEKIIIFLKNVLDPNIDHLQISLDNIYDKYEKIRKNGKFKILDRNIKMALENTLVIKTSMVVTNQNYSDMLSVYKYCSDVGINEIRFAPFFEHEYSELQIPDEALVIKEFCKVLNAYENLNTANKTFIDTAPITLTFNFKRWVEGRYKDLHYPLGNFVCPALVSSCEIEMNGNVYPCSYLNSDQFYIGNILTERLEFIWSKCTGVQGYLTSKICQSCEFHELCKGACPASSFYRTGEFGQGDSSCVRIRYGI